MFEVFKVSITGFNLIPTLFLTLMILYWLTVMSGLMHDHSIDGDADVDVDSDIDGDGLFHSILIFFRMGEVPLALLLSIVSLFWWFITTTVTIVFKSGITMSGILLVPGFIAAYLLTVIAFSPFRKFFKELKSYEKDTVIENKLCKLVTNLEPGRIGQASIATSGAPILINVRSSDGTSMKIGDDAVVVVKDDNSDLYEIKQIKDILNPNATGGSK
jgi:hypothetical protein